MPIDQLLLAALAMAIVANVLLLAVAQVEMRRRRAPRAEKPPDAGRPEAIGQRSADSRSHRLASVAGDGLSAASEDARVAAEIEAFVDGVSPITANPRRRRGRSVPPAAEDGAVPRPTTEVRGQASGRGASRRLETVDGSHGRLEDFAAWNRVVREESARSTRFGRPMTVLTAELRRTSAPSDGNRVDDADGIDPEIAGEIAKLLLNQARSVDRVARLADGRFGILLLEADEVGARGYLDRVQVAARKRLESAGMTLEIALSSAQTEDPRETSE